MVSTNNPANPSFLPVSTSEQLLYSTVRIDTEDDQGNEIGLGTGFLYAYTQLEWGQNQILFLVTNNHVIQGASQARLVFTEEKDNQPLVGSRVDCLITDLGTEFVSHPDSSIDLCAMPIGSWFVKMEEDAAPPFVRAVPSSMVPTANELDDFDAIEDVMFVGYPYGIHDRVNLIPIVRRGMTATPLRLNYQGTPTFLIDASVFSGSSGSPVFTHGTTTGINREGQIYTNRWNFLGVVSSVLTWTDRGVVDFVPIPTALVPVYEVTQLLDIGVVIKSEMVNETVRATLQDYESRGLFTPPDPGIETLPEEEVAT